MSRPAASEYAEYYGRYVERVPDGDIADILETQMAASRTLLASVPADRETHRYAPGKWTVREVVGHMLDTERLFAFRCLWIARAAAGEQPAMEQDEWARVSNAGARPLVQLAAEWDGARRDTVLLLRGLDDAAWQRSGVASGRTFTARACAWIIAGHELHHRTILQERYL